MERRGCVVSPLVRVRRYRRPDRWILPLLFILCLLAAWLLVSPPAFPQERIELPITFDKAEGTILVTVKVNGFDAVLLLDTGSQAETNSH
jgi:hypothetical protein